MVLTDKDLRTKPIIKKPRTLNPLGAVLAGLFLGVSHSLIHKSFIEKNTSVGMGVLGIILIIFAVGATLAALSLSSKFAIFNTRIEKAKTIPAQTALQIVLFYIGFVPFYGFSIAYVPSSIEFTGILIMGACFIIIFAGLVIFNVYQILQTNPSIGHLQKLFFQPRRILIVLLSFIPSVLSTVLLVVF
jgi:hypothetical protein